MINLNAWFQKHGLCAENILYIYRKDRKTVIQRTDGAEFALFVPVHSVLSTLPEKNFLSISKGIVVCRSHIVNISNDGVYTMSDGRTFQGRKRDMSSHRRLRAEIELTNTKHRPLSMLEKCSLLDNMPLAFCVIELVFNEDGCGVDFIFRYCNAEMATVEGVPVEEMLNRSFYRVFPNGDKKWLDLDDYRTACAVNKSFLTLYFFKKVYRILGSPVIIKNNLFHHFNMNILNRFVFGIVIVNISLCELPEILQLNPAYIHSSAFRIKSMISSNERSLSTYASYNACFALSIFRSGCRSSSSVESSSARTLYSLCFLITFS